MFPVSNFGAPCTISCRKVTGSELSHTHAEHVTNLDHVVRQAVAKLYPCECVLEDVWGDPCRQRRLGEPKHLLHT